MNIGMILDKNFPPDPRIENEAYSLLKEGHNVSLFCLSFGNEKANELVNGIRVYRYTISRFLYNKLSPLVYTLPFYNLLLKNKITDFLKNNNFEIIHIHDMIIADLVIKLNKKGNLPIILDLHENRPEIMKYYTHISSGAGKYLISLNKWERKQKELILRANKVVTVSEEQKKDIIKDTNKKADSIYVVPNSVIPDVFFNNKISKNITDRYTNYFVVLYIGSTGRRRGIDTAIKAISNLHEQIQNIKLVIVGTSREDEYFKNLASEYNISGNVDFEGWQNFELFPSYISASDICISPLVRNKHHDSTYTNKQFQYMAMGKPLVVSDCTTQANVVRDANCGLIHKASDENDLAEKILTLYKNKSLRRQLGKNAILAFKEKYNWNETSKNLINLYTKIQTDLKKNG